MLTKKSRKTKYLIFQLLLSMLPAQAPIRYATSIQYTLFNEKALFGLVRKLSQPFHDSSIKTFLAKAFECQCFAHAH